RSAAHDAVGPVVDPPRDASAVEVEMTVDGAGGRGRPAVAESDDLAARGAGAEPRLDRERVIPPGRRRTDDARRRRPAEGHRAIGIARDGTGATARGARAH